MDFEPPKLITVADAARQHGIPKNTLYSAAHTGRIVSQKFGGRLLLDIASCDQYARLYNQYKENPR